MLLLFGAELWREKIDIERHLRVYHEKLPILQEQPTGLAELHSAQPQSQQVLHQGERTVPLSSQVFHTIIQLYNVLLYR